jgi:hypothetical protein
MKSLLEGKKKRKSTGSTREAMVDDNEEKRKRKVTQHQHATQKGLEVEVKFE